MRSDTKSTRVHPHGDLKAPWLMAQETARHMVRPRPWGSIVNIASVLGLDGAEKPVIGMLPPRQGCCIWTQGPGPLELAR